MIIKLQYLKSDYFNKNYYRGRQKSYIIYDIIIVTISKIAFQRPNLIAIWHRIKNKIRGYTHEKSAWLLSTYI